MRKFYVIDICAKLAKRRNQLRGLRIVQQPPPFPCGSPPSGIKRLECAHFAVQVTEPDYSWYTRSL